VEEIYSAQILPYDCVTPAGVKVVVRNVGSQPAGPSTTRVSVASGGSQSLATPGLAPGQSVTLSSTVVGIPPGDTYTAVADWTGVVSEINEANNSLTEFLTVLTLPTCTPTATATPTPTPTPTATPCLDSDADTLCDGIDPDDDNDGCADAREEALGLDPLTWYDFYDVPVPARPDPVPNGGRNQTVDIADVLAVLFYAFAEPTGYCGDNLNANWVDYDCDKGIDTNGDTVADIPPNGLPDGRDYDRSPGLPPGGGADPAGPPNGVIDMADVLAALAQAFAVDCSGPP